MATNPGKYAAAGSALEALEGVDVHYNVPLAKRVSMKVGGPAEILVAPMTLEGAASVWRVVKELGVPVTVLGGGTNVVIADAGIAGVVLDLEPGFGYLREHTLPDGSFRWEVGAGVGTGRVVNLALNRGLQGPEVLAGVPGTMGGALIMNAGGHEGEICSVVERVLVVDEGESRWLSREEAGFSYRASAFPRGAFILGCELLLHKGEQAALNGQVKEAHRRRRVTHPQQFPNAGSIFKNPPGDYAGRLIEKADCKGLQEGMAQVSELHANFIINLGGASASDILRLARSVQARVLERTQVELEFEVKFLGQWGEEP
ncbi:MAG: UDP-N-acetylmuramate dehydrogenase [Myxococcota bacterium]|nr:UDP-N-acetylmuramate dehydrogenase [Myxococcota bacterium]